MNRKFSASMEFQRPDGGVPCPQQPLSRAWRRSAGLRFSGIRATD